MIVWRITKKKHAEPLLNGIGGLYVSGRWHTKGHQIIYTAESQALAILESLVHYEPVTPMDQVIISADLSNVSIKELPRRVLSQGIKKVPHYQLREIGDQWLASKDSCVLKVPSVITPSNEYNYIINPLHDEFSKIKDIHCDDFLFDDRLFK
ncbi:RES family NAD+ phosphorylase [Thiotrichales bacterium 19S9-12]|nr:RES family NAD+ phosphorylase [Thiotrichales bacterium 19S9-11]MCF6811248.1 RES family NAD+ phosphorylase [Thiotrichales bacterium 19S9-12]